MRKETRLTGEQILMQGEMQKLQAENAKLGGMLFAAVGVGERMAFVFPTPIVIEKNGKPTGDALLVVTRNGYKIIHFDRKVVGISVESISEMIKNRLGLVPSSREVGYHDGILAFSDLFISSQKVEDYRDVPDREHSEWFTKNFFNCNLREGWYEERRILEANRKRAQADHSTLQKAGKLPQ